MIVKEKKNYFKGRMVKLKDWEVKLQEDFPFMEQDPGAERNTYKKWGFQCSGGWYQLLRKCCEDIVERYAKDGIGINEIDFVPSQIKEKFGTLRFYYHYTDTPNGIAAFDILSTGESLRFMPKAEGEIDEAKARLREDIHAIVRTAEEKSKDICESCGAWGELRVNHGRYRTLCDSCDDKYIKGQIE